MEFLNETGYPGAWTLGFQKDGRERLIVVIKATFLFPAQGMQVEPAEEQFPLIEEDRFTGTPGESATLYETDFAHFKPRCDVLLNGSAYAPGGRPAEEVQVGFSVGQMSRSLSVIGDRVFSWGVAFLGVSPTHPKPFTVMPITYDRAFGGVDVSEKNPDKRATYLKNPIGRGYYPLTADKALIGKSLPNTQEIGRPAKSPTGSYEPVSFGALGRNFQPRVRFAGTYDEKWLKSRAPFWPDDFDELYFQAAPESQQILYPRGGEPVVLKNLTSEGLARFELPRMRVPVLFIPYRGDDREVEAVIDTLLLEPDLRRFCLTWRATLPLRRDLFEIRQIVAGEMPVEWHRARRAGGRPYYHGLDEFVRSKKRPS